MHVKTNTQRTIQVKTNQTTIQLKHKKIKDYTREQNKSNDYTRGHNNQHEYTSENKTKGLYK